MLVSNKEIDTCLTRLTWDFQPFLAVTRASGVWHVSHASGLTSECAIYDREHTNLIAIVSDKERAKYPTLVSIQRDGSHMLTSVFERAIDDAERTRDATATHRQQ